MWVEETNNGKYKYVERYTDFMTGKMKRVSVVLDKNTAQSKKIAQRALDDKIDAALSNKTESGMALSELIDKYRTDQIASLKQSTCKRNYSACNTLISILGKDTLVNRLTAKYIRNQLLLSHKKAGTLNELLTRLKALLRWGYQNDYIQDVTFLNKLEPFKDTPKREKIQDKYLENYELKKLIDCMNIDVWRLVTQFLSMTGVRVGELIALENTDIDLDDKVIHVTKTYDPNNLIVTSTKTLTSTRDVFIQEELVAVIKNLRILMLQQKLMHGYDKSKLFACDTSGGHLHYDAYRKYLKENAEKSIGRPITPHVLRHTHASLLLENGVGIDTISRRLGHENSKVTKEIYLHVTEKLKDKDNAQIASIKFM